MSQQESAPNASTAQARVLVDELARGGLRDVILCPGSRSAPFAFAFDAEPRIRVHLHPDERSAAFVALGIARATGRAAAVVVTSGTAVANLHPAVMEADLAGVPLLLLTADRPPELRDTGADQAPRQLGIFGSALRWSLDLGVAEDRADAVATWRASASRALAEARGLAGAPGPVQLNVAFREPTVPLTDDGRTVGVTFTTPLAGPDVAPGIDRPRVTVQQGVRRLDDAAIAQLVSRCAAERGLIVVGSGASSGLEDAAIADAVLRLSAVTGWPVLAEGHTAARHRDGALKAWPHLLESDAFRDANRPEIVMRIGRATLTRTLSELTHRAREIVIDAHGRWWDPARRMSELLHADPADTLNRIAEALGMSTSSIWTDRWRAADAAAVGVLDAAFTEDVPGPEGTQQPVSAGARAVRAVIDGAPLGAHVVVAASMAIRHVDRQSLQRPDLVWHANRGAAGIDGNVSTALGVAIGSRRPVVAIVGDLALLHDTNAWLLTAETDEAAPDVTVVVLDDDGGSIFDLLPPGQFPAQRHLFATPHGRNLRNLAALHDLAFIDVPIGGTSSAAVTGAVAGAVGPGRRLIRVAVPPQAREQSGALRTLFAVALAGIPGD